jgi:hypothetical protein
VKLTLLGWEDLLTPVEEPRLPGPPPQCHCGRFFSPATFRQSGPDLDGVIRWTWRCSKCGITGDST